FNNSWEIKLGIMVSIDSWAAGAEHLRVTRQVMKEAKDDLIRVREAINNYINWRNGSVSTVTASSVAGC
ncbi:MAG: hypothetical protein R6X06_08715, partial [Gammaproteobacteria bacterium]